MPNKNYQSGRNLEYKVVHELQANGYKASRTAGSHGAYDVVGVRHGAPVELVQCKVTAKPGVANALISKFKTNPPLVPDKYYHQTLRVYCTTNRETSSVTV